MSKHNFIWEESIKLAGSDFFRLTVGEHSGVSPVKAKDHRMYL